jgi:hypothetical protein
MFLQLKRLDKASEEKYKHHELSVVKLGVEDDPHMRPVLNPDWSVDPDRVPYVRERQNHLFP